MPLRILIAGLLLGGIGVSMTSPSPARADEAKWFLYERQLGQLCRPPYKFAAGACVPFCPAGFEDNGSTCRLYNQSRGGRG
jgi:hypothetical protein